MNSAIQRVEEQGGALTELGGVTWTRELLDLAKKSLCPSGITDTEFELFIMQCRTRGLNPFAGEAFCVARRTNTGTKESPKWVTNHVLQTSVEGMRARAVRHGDMEEFQGAAIFDKDTCVIDMDAGTVHHKYDAAKQRGVFVGAWAKVKRRGMRPVIIHLLPGSRRADGPVYANNPSEHLMKCAKGAALRDAYPVAFSGVYAREEMPEENSEPNKAEQVLGSAAGGSPTKEVPALPAVGATVVFGGWRGRPVAALTGSEAKDAVCFANAKIAESPRAKWVKTMQENRDAIAKHHDIPADLVDAGTADAQPVSSEPSEAEKAEILAQEMAMSEPGSAG